MAFKFAGGAGHQIASADVIVIGGGEFLEMQKEVGAEVKLHLSGDPLDDAALGRSEGYRQRTRPQR